MDLLNIVELIACILVCQLAGYIGSVFTTRSLVPWYSGLKKPSFAPSGKIIGTIWIVLFVLMGISLFLVLEQGLGRTETIFGVALFGGQLAFNVLWSYVFFGLRSPGTGVAIIAMLWLAIAATIVQFAMVSLLAATLLLPYIAWVSVAAYLNIRIVDLNKASDLAHAK
jgi:translocator protein